MAKTVVIVHTGPVTIEPLNRLGPDLLPGVRLINIVDDSLLKDVMAAGHVTPAVRKRLAQYMLIGEEMGADVILNACSSVGEAADAVAPLLSVPIVKIDTAMAELAVMKADRIGVVATVKTTLDPTTRLIEQTAARLGKAVRVWGVVCPGAFDHLLAGRMAEHDEIVSNELLRLAADVDLIVLAQVSMGRVAAALGDSITVPVLTSPRLGIERLAQVLAEQEIHGS